MNTSSPISVIMSVYNRCSKLFKRTLTEEIALLAALRQKKLRSYRKNNFFRNWKCRFIMKKFGQDKKIVKLQGGLGNQMFQYAFGQAVKAASGCQVLYDIGWFRKKHKKLVAQREYMLSLFNIDADFASDTQARIFAGKNILYKLIGGNVTKISEDGQCSFHLEWLNIPGNVYYDGYFPNGQYFKDIEAKIRQDFTFPPISKDDEFNQKWLKRIADCENPVFIHIRRGDYLNLDGWLLPIEYYRKAVEYIVANVNNPTFFVFGSECEDFIKNDFDINYPFEFIGEENARNHEDWKDMALMAMCKHCIIANSTFSWWAAWLGNTEQKSGIIIAPSSADKSNYVILQSR